MHNVKGFIPCKIVSFLTNINYLNSCPIYLTRSLKKDYGEKGDERLGGDGELSSLGM